MIPIKKEGVILKHTNLEFENQAVLNPTCIKEGNNVHMFYRAVKQGNYSTIGYCKLDGPLAIAERLEKPILFPEFDYEKHGIEDPRIVFLDGKYYITYMGYNGKDVVAAYAISKDLRNFEKKGILFPCCMSYAEAKKIFIKANMPAKYFDFEMYNRVEKDTAETTFLWGKDVVLFPKKIKGKFAMLYRVLPNIHLIYFKDFKDLTMRFWKNHLKRLSDHVVIDTKYWFESRAIGAGCVPIETDEGWLLIYHTIENAPIGRIYRACAALLDKKDPRKVRGRLNYPLFGPEKEWELKGDVSNVVFPTGAAIFNKKLYVYYGAADSQIAVASVDLKELLNELVNPRQK